MNRRKSILEQERDRAAAKNGKPRRGATPASPAPSPIVETTPGADGADHPRPAAELVVESLGRLTPKPVVYLVPNRIPAGMLGLLAGEGGHGKSMTTLELAAAVTVVCEFCGDRECIVCARGEGDLAGQIRWARQELAAAEDRAAELRRQLAGLLAEAGRRPGDGSDQPPLFDPDAQAKLF